MMIVKGFRAGVLVSICTFASEQQARLSGKQKTCSTVKRAQGAGKVIQ